MNIALISNLGKPPDGKVTPREDREAKNLLISFSVAHNLKTDPFIFSFFFSYKIYFPRLTIVVGEETHLYHSTVGFISRLGGKWKITSLSKAFLWSSSTLNFKTLLCILTTNASKIRIQIIGRSNSWETLSLFTAILSLLPLLKKMKLMTNSDFSKLQCCPVPCMMHVCNMYMIYKLASSVDAIAISEIWNYHPLTHGGGAGEVW